MKIDDKRQVTSEARKLTARVYRDEKRACTYLGDHVTPRTLRKLRTEGGGPRYIRIGNKPLYRDDWLDEWADANAVTSTSAETARKRA